MEIKEKGLTGELAFNTGNCFYRMENYGRALQWYKKAEKYLFADPDLKFNIHSCMENLSVKKENNAFLSDYIFFTNKIFSESFTNTLFLAFEILFILMIVFFPKGKLLKTKLIIGFSALYLISASAFNFFEESFFKKAIILENSKVYSAYSTKASVLFNLDEGTKIIVKNKKNDFYKIETNKGKPGWVQGKSIGLI